MRVNVTYYHMATSRFRLEQQGKVVSFAFFLSTVDSTYRYISHMTKRQTGKWGAHDTTRNDGRAAEAYRRLKTGRFSLLLRY